MADGQTTPLIIVMRGLGAMAMLSVLANFYGETFASLFLPIFQHVITALLDPGWAVRALRVVTLHDEARVWFEVAVPPFLQHGVAVSGATAEAATLIGHVLQIPLLALSIAIAFPLSWCRRLLSLGLIALIVTVIELVDTPVVLVDSVYAVVSSSTTVLETWSRLLDDGGRFLLSIGGGIGSVAMCGAVRWKQERSIYATAVAGVNDVDMGTSHARRDGAH